METTEVTNEVKRVLYWRDAEAENKTRSSAEAAARALNELMSHYKFKDISEIPANVQEWITKRTLETNPKLAKLAETHRLESLKFEVPDWIKRAGNAFSNWHATKSTHIPFMRFLIQKEEYFIVNADALETEFESTSRKYLTDPEQLKRLDFCRRYISMLKDLLKDADLPESIHSYVKIFGRLGNPYIRIVNEQIICCKEFVLSGEKLLAAPVAQNPNFYLSGWHLIE
jgi:hypothetical protein